MIFQLLLLLVIVILLVYLFFQFAGTLLAPGVSKLSIGEVCIKNNCFQVEIAKTALERDKGLMYREKLDRDKGMLFIFNKEGIYPFWMKNTLIPLDIVWIDANNKVVFVGENVQPCKTLICSSVVPNSKAKYVLEINSGICQEIGLKVGDEIEIKN